MLNNRTIEVQGDAPRALRRTFVRAFIVVVVLNFMWGFSYGLSDVLNKHLQETLGITQAQSGLVQSAIFAGYFVVALPASSIAKKHGFKIGIIFGLSMFAAGAVLFVPATAAAVFVVFLLAMYVMSAGMGSLEATAHPLVTLLGAPEHASSRLNFAQAFNGVGTLVGPLVGATLFFGQTGDGMAIVRNTYLVMAAVLVVVAVLVHRTTFPPVEKALLETPATAEPRKKLWDHPQFRYAMPVVPLAIGAYVGVSAFFINFAQSKVPDVGPSTAAVFLSVGLAGYALGRFAVGFLLRRFSGRAVLTGFAGVSAAALTASIVLPSWWAVATVVASFLAQSAVYPTAFSLGVRNLGSHTQRASGVLVMCIGCGVILPPLVGATGDHLGNSWLYLVPAACYTVIALLAKKVASAE